MEVNNNLYDFCEKQGGRRREQSRERIKKKTENPLCYVGIDDDYYFRMSNVNIKKPNMH